MQYTLDEFKNLIIAGIESGKAPFGLKPTKLEEIVINGNFEINGKQPLLYLLQHTKELATLIAKYSKKNNDKKEMEDLYKELAKDPNLKAIDGKTIIEHLVVEVFNRGGRGLDDFIKIMEEQIKGGTLKPIPESLADLIVKSKIRKWFDDHKNEKHNFDIKELAPYGDRILVVFVNECLASNDTSLIAFDQRLQGADSNEKSENELKKEFFEQKYIILRDKLRLEDFGKVIPPGVYNKQRALKDFVSDPKACFKELANMIKRVPAQKMHEIEQAQEQIDLASLYKQYDLETLKNLDELGRLLNMKKEASSPWKNIGIAIAVITVLPGLVLGIAKLVSSYREKKALAETLTKIEKVNKEMQVKWIKTNNPKGNIHTFFETLKKSERGKGSMER